MIEDRHPPFDRTTVLVSVRASPARRVFGVGVLVGLGALLLWLGVSQPAALGWRAVLAALGLACVWGGLELWRSTGDTLVLTPGGLFAETGVTIAPLAEIRSVDRGAFAFKPSNGFGIRLKSSAGPAWAPGLWWRFGRRVGVGGVTPAAPARAMAETLTAMIAERDGAL